MPTRRPAIYTPETVFIGSRTGPPVKQLPSLAVGQGGEADIYDLGNGQVAKIFRPPEHPDIEGRPSERQAAMDRIRLHQRKLPALMAKRSRLPGRLVTPTSLIYDQRNGITGYTMPFIRGTEALNRFSQRSFRQQGVATDQVITIFRDLHQTVEASHRAQLIFGDFNDLNVLVKDNEAYVVDVDSAQFDGFPCPVFTARFVDPLLCDQKQARLQLVRPYTEMADWYAYAVMLFGCLLFVDPYGGIYRPKDSKRRILHDRRPLDRITVFHPEVIYPKPALHYGLLPDDLLDYFQQVFTKDQREAFPSRLLETFRWTKCTSCGTEHGRPVCPNCQHHAPAVVIQSTTIRGHITATQLFRTSGTILFAASHGGELRWLYHEAGAFRREDRQVMLRGELDPKLRFRLRDRETLIGLDHQLAVFTGTEVTAQLTVDTYGQLPVFDANDRHRYWLQNGRLLRDGEYSSEHLGDVLEGQTIMWAGSRFGFGLSRAGQLQIGFVFDAERRGINDSLKLPRFPGQWLDSTCVFGHDRAWFFLAVQDRGRTKHHCVVVLPNGSIAATAVAEANDGSWLGTLRGKTAAGQFLLAATDDGLVRLEVVDGQITTTKTYPDTEPFVDASCHLFLTKHGLAVVNRQTITRLTMTP